MFKTDTAVVPASKMDEYRVVFIYKDPVESLVSRFDHNHCTHVQVRLQQGVLLGAYVLIH